jgi:hypothetical protein
MSTKENIVAAAEWRTVQLFLSTRGVFEVEVDLSSRDVRCTCPNYNARKACKHASLVTERMDKNGGTYPLKVSSKAPADEATRANESAEEFRDFVVHYGKVEVI